MNNINQMGTYNPQRSQFPTYFNSTPGVSTSTNNIVWVQGIEGAKAWQLSPNSMVILLDSEVEGKMYIKVSDNIGMSSLRVFNYVEEIPVNTSTKVTNDKDLDLTQYVRKDELTELLKEILNEQSISTAASESGKSVESFNNATAESAAKPKIIYTKK
jgi:hypothetical protein